jgi:hypothetical protein
MDGMASDRYRGCLIQAAPRKLADGSGWTPACTIVSNMSGTSKLQPVSATDVFKTEEAAAVRSLDLGREAIDRTLGPK